LPHDNAHTHTHTALTSERGEETRFSSTEERADLEPGGVMELTGPRPMPWPEGTGTGTAATCVAPPPPSALRRRPSNADCRDDRSELELPPPPSAALALVSAAPNACEEKGREG
jgi:hypothetical protein